MHTRAFFTLTAILQICVENSIYIEGRTMKILSHLILIGSALFLSLSTFAVSTHATNQNCLCYTGSSNEKQQFMKMINSTWSTDVIASQTGNILSVCGSGGKSISSGLQRTLKSYSVGFNLTGQTCPANSQSTP